MLYPEDLTMNMDHYEYNKPHDLDVSAVTVNGTASTTRIQFNAFAYSP